MFKEYIYYLRDNPNRLWFKRKLYGWGWTPATWQGWLTIALYIGCIILLTNVMAFREASTLFVIGVVLLTFILILICYKTGEAPRWQWGRPKERQ